jgi:hypothetical protein
VIDNLVAANHAPRVPRQKAEQVEDQRLDVPHRTVLP